MAELETNTTETGETTPAVETGTESTEPQESQELAKLRAEMARQKAALDKATKEAGDYKKQLRARQSAEEVAAEEKRAQDEARDAELADLRKRFAVAEISKKVLGFVGDEKVSNSVAEYLYGAEDADAAVAELNKAWTAREKTLRLEYGKIPAPGVGAGDGPTITKEQLDAMNYMDRLEFANKHPDEYARLVGR